jgi:2'-5' RNA ligase
MRLFVAVKVPEEVAEKVVRLCSELPKDAIKAVKPENMHITLRFIGESNDNELKLIKNRLEKIKFEKFLIKLTGIGVFPNSNYVKVVWVACKSEELNSLAERVVEALRGIGKEEKREFSAHLTIARVKQKIDVCGFLQKYQNMEFGEFEVSSFELMESKLEKGGAVYSVAARFEDGY